LAERLAAMPKTGDGAMQIIARGRLALAVAAALVLAATGAAAGATLDHIRQDKTHRLSRRRTALFV
jgi:hypothetical protein